jgi:NAD+ kinase
MDEKLRVIMLGSGQRPDVAVEAERLRPVISKLAQIVASDFTGSVDMSKVEADVAIVLGGDGSILRAAHQMGQQQLPVIAVNLGKLGFLADLSPDEVSGVLGDFGRGNLAVVEHLMFDVQVIRGGQICFEKLGLNEVAVQTGPPFAVMNVDLYVDSELVTTYSCDGLIVSTPVGSTAHSLSAGGPILRKDLSAFVILPISPHTLTNRPVVDSATRIYELVVADPNPDTSVVVDGGVLCTLRPGDRVRVEQASVKFKLVVAGGHSYYRTLREKLGWGGRLNLEGES